MKINILNLLKTLIRVVPLVGDIKENLDSKDRGRGNLDPEKLITALVRIGVIVGTSQIL